MAKNLEKGVEIGQVLRSIRLDQSRCSNRKTYLQKILKNEAPAKKTLELLVSSTDLIIAMKNLASLKQEKGNSN